MKQPSLDETDAAIARMRERLAARNSVLARWFSDTLAAMEMKIASRSDDPDNKAEARAAAFIFVKTALHQWASRPAHETVRKDRPVNGILPSRRPDRG